MDKQREDAARQFEAERPRLRALGFRLLGSDEDAEDAVQEAWLRFDRTLSAGDTLDNVAAWLTTVTSRLCLDHLRSRAARPEEPGELPVTVSAQEATPEEEAERIDDLGRALAVVIETLSPAERVAFVMHDLFGVPFEVIAPVVDRAPAATRQLASRARRRVQQAEQVPAFDRERAVVAAFLAATRNGEFDDLLQLLDPNAVLRADEWSVRLAAGNNGAPLLRRQVTGASAVAQVFSGRASAAQPALIDGRPGFAWAPDGRPRSVFVVTVVDGRVAAIDQAGDPTKLRGLQVVLT